MAGGNWLSQNKVRPGAYINFKAVSASGLTTGDRGIVAIPLELNWGAEDKLIEVYSSDLLYGTSNKLIGFDAFSEESKLLAAALKYCYKALVYRANSGGNKATATIENLKVTANYNGTLGNNIIITITEDTKTGLFNVITYVKGEVKDTQKVSNISELVKNDYVEFEKSAEENSLVANAGTSLNGGSNGQAQESTYYPKFLKHLKVAKWQVLICNSEDNSIKSNVCTFIQKERDDEGRYVQAVVSKYDGADNEGIINSVCGAVINNVTFTPAEFTSIVGGITAGANFNQSNTAKVIEGATSIIDPLEDTDIKIQLGEGKFILSESTSGKIKVEQDINSLHTFTADKTYSWSKNRVLRTLDEIGTSVKQTWEDMYMGKVDNDPIGRDLFKGDIIQYGNELQRLRALQNFAGGSDVEVLQGNDLDSVLVNLTIQPVDSMEKLYMTVNVNA